MKSMKLYDGGAIILVGALLITFLVAGREDKRQKAVEANKQQVTMTSSSTTSTTVK